MGFALRLPPLAVAAWMIMATLTTVDPAQAAEIVRTPEGILSGPAGRPGNNPAQTAEAMAFTEALDTIMDRYDGKVDRRQLAIVAIDAMLKSLDAHSKLHSGADEAKMRLRIAGEISGIGITYAKEPDGLRITGILQGSPAEQGGLIEGDVITDIDGLAFEKGMNHDTFADRISGAVDTSVALAVRHPGDDGARLLTFTRARVKHPSVSFRMEGNVGYIQVTTFSQGTIADLIEAAVTLKHNPAVKPVGFILDLRNNPGGDLLQAVWVADAFLETGTIVRTAGRTQFDNRTYSAKPGDVIEGKPLLVLINEKSASSAEVVAAALQENDRAMVMGATSYGKGSVQRVIRMRSLDASIRVTSSHYFTPKDRSIQGIGVIPNIVLPDGVRDVAIARAVTTIQETAAGTQASGGGSEPGRAQQEGRKGAVGSHAVPLAASPHESLK